MDQFILGDNQFFGVNHHSRSTGADKAKRFSKTSEIIEVMCAAKRHGAGGVMLSAHDRVKQIIQAMRCEPELANFNVYANVPYLMKYVQKSTQAGLIGLVKDMVIGQAGPKRLYRAARAYLKRDFRQLLCAGIDIEMAAYQRFNIKAIFLHNGIVDLVLGLGLVDVLHDFDNYVRNEYQAIPGYGTLNLPLCVETLKKASIPEPLIMAPFNHKGFHMNPSRLANEHALVEGGFKLLAMNVMVSGGSNPQIAFEYLGQFPKLKHVIIGASSENHLEQNARLIKQYCR
ncbi:MAG: hypothetical protein ACI9CF_000748 [Candidatus Omnitrophota bacterium]|jgi:hypothetical protein